MPESLFDEMKRYVRWDDDDARRLATLAPHARPRFRGIAEQFYERIREHEDAHAVLRDEAQIERLRVSLVRWMERLCGGVYDEAYFEERAKIGRIHVRIGLPQRYMFTAMALIREALQDIVASSLPADEARHTRSALDRILDLELAIMLETYRDDYVSKLQRVERLEKEELERALARSESRYSNAVELAAVLVVGVDARGRIALFNREAERVTGVTRYEAIGEPFVSLLPEDQRAEAESVLARGEQPPTGPWEADLITRAGKRRTIAWQLARVPDAPSGDVVVFAVGSDVTDARALQQRDAQTEKLAAVGTLAAGLAHEIRNPLNGALLHVTFLDRALAKQGASVEALDAVKLVGDEIRRLSALVKEFLVFARPSPPHLEPVSLGALAARVAGVVAADAQAAKAEVVVDPGASELRLELDASRLEQALLNLVRNAIDAVGGAGGGRVTLRLRRLPRAASIEVEDDGPGLPSPDAPIFDAFYSTKPQGTGLGLAIVHRVVTDHDGTIDVESRPGRTVFRIVLPIRGGEQA
jgi:PAS domain S-box-containing protein